MSGGKLKRVKEQEKKNLFDRWATGLSGNMSINWANEYLHNNFTSILSWQVFISSHLDPPIISLYYLPFTA